MNWKLVIIILTGAVTTISTGSPVIGLIIGLTLSLILKNSYQKFSSSEAKYLLQFAVILLGFGIKIDTVIRVGVSTFWITIITITFTLAVGWLLGRLLKTENEITTLISSGTAICGGSAIAAVSPAIGASQAHTAISLTVVFVLNAVGLVIFPAIGEMLAISQESFGIWSALAIHDTSSVVGAAAIYGSAALAVATTVKLTRALWILPLSLGLAFVKKSESRAKFPWFLLGFILAAILSSYLPQLSDIWRVISFTGKRLMVTTLFLIGLGLTLADLRKVGFRPLVLATILWVIVSLTTLFVIQNGWITL